MKRTEGLIQEVSLLENEWKTKMENEKSLLNNGNHSENIGNEKSFSKTRNSGKRNEKVENENGGGPKDETIDPWDIEKTPIANVAATFRSP
ncbi:MAG: hypothetical protein L0Y68_00270 [Candidatus Dadabacteria bacterium]|nr:hypothetical protein [Candidatus Dadabacteria bacterium]